MNAKVPKTTRVVISVVALLLFLNCSGIFVLNVKDFEPLSSNLKRPYANAGFEKVTNDYGWETKHYVVDGSSVRLRMYGGGLSWRGYSSTDRGIYLNFKIENNSDSALIANKNDFVLRPTRVDARWFGKPFNGPTPTVKAIHVKGGDSSGLLWSEENEVDLEKGILIKDGESAMIGVKFDFGAALRKAFFDITLRKAETNEPFVYRFRMKKN